MSSGVRPARKGGGGPAKIYQWPPLADYGPARQFDSVGCSLRHLCRDTSSVLLRCTRWRSRAATWVSLMTPQRNAAEVQRLNRL